MFSQSKRFHPILVGAFLVASISAPMAAQNSTPLAQPDVPLVLKITTREVVLYVLARDKNHNSVGDLAENEFQVFPAGKNADKNPLHILSMRVIDPRSGAARVAEHESGFSIHSGAICAHSFITHYELTVPASPEPGFHQVLIKTTRPGVTLSFRHQYYVGPTPTGTAKQSKDNAESISLGDAACFHTFIPSTLALTAHPVLIPGGKSTRYTIVIRPESLYLIGLDGANTHVHLDVGMCTFDASGNFAQFFHTSSDRDLTPSEIQDAQAHGLTKQVEIPGDTPYLVRLVIRDHETGNLGTVDVSRPVSLTGQSGQEKFQPPPVGLVRAFGVITPLPNSFCGDFYEISFGAAVIPDFWNLDPIASIYTNALNVQDQDESGQVGIPGVSHTVEWFGIDYYGEFYITNPGEYKFDLEADDGARLEIDNKEIIENDELHGAQSKTAKVTLAAGRHTIHVPYFQGSPTNVALILAVKPPNGPTRPFNLADYPVPQKTP
jgi:hypothetical protein